MKRITFTLALLGVVALAGTAWADKDKGAQPAEGHAHHHAAMARYMVISPHTETECLQALDDVHSMGATALGKWQFGCMDGDHTGYCIVSASSADEALRSVPASVRGKARAVKMHTFTAAELKGFHEKMKS